MNKKKIGLCIAYKGSNYGQLLQAFATQRVVQQLGYETEIIDYRSGLNKGIKPSICAVYVSIKHITGRLFVRNNAISHDDLHKLNISEREVVSESFRKERLDNIVICNGYHELKRQSNNYYAVIVGSDQLWLPNVAASNFYTLRFAGVGVKKISYATSLGVSKYPWYARGAAADFLKRIDYISVREEAGKKLIRSMVDIPVEVVADPTYLLTYDEWSELFPNKRTEGTKYVLCFFLGDDLNIKKYASNFAERKGLRIVSILSNECDSDDSVYADEIVTGRSPEEFINLIRNAEYILTDSFHGIAFSVINRKQFFAFYRKRTDTKESRNSRIDNIVKLWGIEDRLVREPEKLVVPDGEIDYAIVIPKVEEMREKSLAFLENALNS